ncbi:MAG: hypothetical protein SFV81_22590 [Pirellulaceae bacterium]|nr:hypothetical protein [Pirellulaceae bacterium]
MRKFLGFLIAAGLIVAVAGATQAQTVQGCGGTVQSYQRYSYQPAPTGAVVQSGVVNGPVIPSPAAVNPLPQVYRRFSYAPQSYYGSTTGHGKNLWEYAKGDSRRYRP